MAAVLATIQVLLQRVGDQPAVVRARWQQVWDAVVVVVIVALVSLSVFVSVQLGAVDDSWAVVPGILVTVAITEFNEYDFIRGDVADRQECLFRY